MEGPLWVMHYDKHELSSVSDDIDQVCVNFFDGNLDEDIDAEEEFSLSVGEEIVNLLAEAILHTHPEEPGLEDDLEDFGEWLSDAGFLVTPEAYGRFQVIARQHIDSIKDDEETAEMEEDLKRVTEAFPKDGEWDSIVVYVNT